MLTAGDVLGDCEILSPLGRGGMGEVYLARDRRLGPKVAVKVLPASFSSDASRLARFEREARSASSLNHPNICTIHALGELADGRRFIVMEHVDGVTLRTLGREPLDLARSVAISRQLAEGLAAAHDTGVVHRDVKPENVMVRADGLVKVLDFGLAKLLPESAMAAGESTHSVEASLAGGVVGTVPYMSPEQARGQPIDARTDVWAVGAVLLTGGSSRTRRTDPATSISGCSRSTAATRSRSPKNRRRTCSRRGLPTAHRATKPCAPPGDVLIEQRVLPGPFPSIQSAACRPAQRLPSPTMIRPRVSCLHTAGGSEWMS